MKAAIAVAFRTQQRVAGEEVTYHAGDRQVPLIAVPGRTLTEQEDDDGGLVQWHAQDWLLLSSDLAKEEKIIPDRGHSIVDAEGQVWRVLDDGATPAWRYNDQFRVVMRVHTKLSEVCS